ncbi:phosphofructokinase [Williamsia sp. 1135]|nr:1-phosphofructokinase family hexose kinase [Williamsia sp. 1135]ORM36778.1 phosphofructokinase [Williamsia sp. 1135]
MPGILTLTMNPALDIHTSVPQLMPTEKMRCGVPRYDPGGGGVNVARALVSLGTAAAAVVTSGGHSGAHLRALLADDGVEVHAVSIAEPTRESMTITEQWTDNQYRFVLPGPVLRMPEERRCLRVVDQNLPTDGYLVVSGSMPPGCSGAFFARIATIAARHNCRIIVDTSGPALRHVTNAHLLKPSIRELRDHVGAALADRRSQVAASRDLIAAKVCEIVVISLGRGGALLVTADSATDFDGIPVPSGTGVGAGDNMVAAITYGLAREWTLIEAVRFGTAAGAATLLTPGTQPAERAEVDRLYARAVAEAA